MADEQVTEAVETPVVVETSTEEVVVDVEATPSGEPIVETKDEKVEVPEEEKTGGAEPAKDEEAVVVDESVKDDKEEPKKDEATEEVSLIEATAELPEILEKADKVLEKYELSPDLQNVFDVLKAKAEAIPTTASLPDELADFGDTETIQSRLTRENYLRTSTELENGSLRPDTNKFVADLVENDPEKADWLHYDLAKSPSTKYKGLDKFVY